MIFITKCGIAVFSEPGGCGVLAFWMVLEIILQDQCLPKAFSSFHFDISNESKLSVVNIVKWNLT